MRWPRFRVRTLLVLVVLAGVSIGGCVLWQRSVEYRRRADGYADPGYIGFMTGWSPAEVERYNVARKAYFAEMARKYDRAARYPWLPVAPDPPPPELEADAE